MGRVTIDPRELLDALELPAELGERFLDTATGTVVTMYGEDDDDPEQEHDPATRVDLPRLTSRDEYEWMADFAESLVDDEIKERLRLALRGQGAFGRFKHVLDGDLDLRDAWFAARQRAMLAYVQRWLEREGIDAELAPPLPDPAPATRAQVGKRDSEIDLLDLLLLGAPDGKTEIIDGRVTRRVTARSPDHARALFRKLARELAEWHGVSWRKGFVEGQSRFAVERAEITVDGTSVELRIAVSRSAWNTFYPRSS
jgi:hypothetical protein